MNTDTDTAFAVIQRALEQFNAGVGRAQADQTRSEEAVASVEYEIEQMKKLLKEHALAG